MKHCIQDLINLFQSCFFEKYNTVLVKGEDEPLYLPADQDRKNNTIFFAHGYFSSALHECAHWLIAGENRRKLVDFGYWYIPDGRSTEQQEIFQSVEVKPQAIEWILSKAAGYRFRVSIDNLNGQESDTESFKRAVFNQVKLYCEQGLPPRAKIFYHALSSFYATPVALKIGDFDVEMI